MKKEYFIYMKKNIIFRYGMILIGSIIYSAGVSLFFDANNIAPGGLTGISIIISRFSGVETGTLIFILNIPIMILGLWKFGFKFIVSTWYTIGLISIFTNIFSTFGEVTSDPLVATMMGGAMVAFGISVAFKCGATTGGTDIIVKVLRLRFKHLKTGYLFLAIDLVVVAISGIVFRDINLALYAAIGVFVCSYLIDILLYGKDEAKLIYIISDEAELIVKKLLEELEVGATYLEGEGAYSGIDKKILMCVMRKQKAPRAEEIVKEVDANSFMIITNANEIYGEGYKSYGGERL